MITFTKPTQIQIERFLTEQSPQEVSYSAVGGTKTTPPKGYVVDRTRGKIGEGRASFDQAKEAIRQWQHFELGWVTPCWKEENKLPPIEENQVVGILARAFGVWFLNACRIVDTIDEADCFGFAYGTLPGHVESGEERFQVEFDPQDESVYYDILAFSRPNHLLTRLGYPITRKFQRKFARDSVKAMQFAIQVG